MGNGYEPVNACLQKEARTVLDYLESIRGKQVVLGQHTQTRKQEELEYIQEVTGRLPALCGFELLAYSPNIDYENSDEECLTEVEGAKGTLKQAWEWAKRKGLITFTWHWFSPLYGAGKTFYSRFTPFDPLKVLQAGSEEHTAFMSDMDYMAGLLKPFCDAHIPILWRPFHECDGVFFWWGRQGGAVAQQLYRMMYERYTKHFHLDNLIWVFNSAAPDIYPGDDVVDVISRDLYPSAHKHMSCTKELAELKSMTKQSKLCAIGEIGTMPDVRSMIKEGLDWTYYMTWSNEYGKTEQYTSKDFLRQVYEAPEAVTLDKLPQLY